MVDYKVAEQHNRRELVAEVPGVLEIRFFFKDQHRYLPYNYEMISINNMFRMIVVFVFLFTVNLTGVVEDA